MNDDGVPFALLVLVVVLFWAGWGVASFVTDARSFSDVVAGCKQRGYIQNETTRIFCQVEVRP
jgi:hypothetical protein